MHEPAFTVSEFVAVLNQTLDYAYPGVIITGELAHFKISKNRWVYFDLKDELATVRFFGTVYQLPGPLEDGMMVAVRGMPRLHPQFGFSVNVQTMQPVGEGAIKKAAQLLEAKLTSEGLFDPARKRQLPYPPRHIGLITSAESAAYRDFIKILEGRFGGLVITLVDVQVQGEAAPAQIVQAIELLNQRAETPDVLVITRGGGSAEDLQAFSTEQVTRAVAGSRIPTLVAIGHEVDISLAELAADQRGSTPSNAAELLVPDRKAMQAALILHRTSLRHYAKRILHGARQELRISQEALQGNVSQVAAVARQRLTLQERLLSALDPQAALARGYALVRKGSISVRSSQDVAPGDTITIRLQDAELTSVIKRITMRKNHE